VIVSGSDRTHARRTWLHSGRRRPLPLARTAGQRLARPWRLHRLRTTYGARVAHPTVPATLRAPSTKLARFIDLPKPLHEAGQQVLTEALRVVKHEVDYLGSGFVNLGAEIDWHTDFKSGYSWPPMFYQDVDVTRLDDTSDAKFPWEVSRCHHLLTLARAARIYEDDRFATEFEAQLWSWLEWNPTGYGINWVNPMEVAIRAVNWIWAIGTLEPWRTVDPSLRAALTRSLQAHGRHIASNLEGSPLLRSNHYLANILGLLALGACLEEDPQAPKWLRFAQRELEREIKRQVLPDGVGFEASLPYHGLALEMFLLGWGISQLARRPLSRRYRDRLIRMLDVSRSVRHPDGRSPIFGDQDSGRVLPAGLSRPPTHDHLLDLGSALLDLPRLTPEEHPHEEVAWTLGLQTWRRLVGREDPAPAAPNAFCSGGLYVMRGEEIHLVARWGGVGQNGNGGHAHNDLSSYELSYGVPVVVDSGTYLYTADPAARDAFRSAGAHNVVVVDRLDMHPLPARVPFQLPEYARFAIEAWEQDGEMIILRGWHDGYRRQNATVTCRRTIRLERVKEAVEIIDEVEGEGTRDVESLIHLAVGCDVEQERPDALRVEAGERELTITFAGARRVTVEEGWVSSHYGVRERARLIRATTDVQLPARLSYRIAPR
jgi:hypothetical protein